MPEYIEREAFYRFLTEQKDKETGAYSKGRNAGLDVARSALHNKEITPAADVVSKATFEQVKWERDTAMEQLNEHGIPFGGKADVVAVVRCKDCEYRADGTDKGHYLCNRKMIGLVRPDDFCSFGERRG